MKLPSLQSACLLAASLVVACGGSDDSGGSGGGPQSPDPVTLEVDCTDSIDSIYADPGTLPDDLGAILRCAEDTTLTADAIQQIIDPLGYQGAAMTSGAAVYRVTYRTERGDEPPTPGYSSAIVYLPTVPRAEKLPTLVVSHGSRGQGEPCAASQLDPIAGIVNDDFQRLVLPLAGAGYAVIAPDLAGYANFGAPDNPPSPYGGAADTGKSTLDGSRALARLAPSRLLDEVVLVGHSLGGHTALSALALAESYGSSGPIAAVATFAPLWISQASWGAVLALPSFFPIADSPAINANTIWYHYTHGELLDGPGRGGDVFLPSKRADIDAFVAETCWGYPEWSRLKALGATAEDFFAPEFRQAVGQAASGLGACPSDPDLAATCQLWLDRYAADRPHLTGAAASVPQALLWGGADGTIAFDRITCAIDRLRADAVNLETVCVDPAADHGGIMDSRYEWVFDWIDSKVLGSDAPGDCGDDETAIVDDAGDPAMCNMVPPND